MSIIFGFRMADSAPVEASYLIELAHATERYALDGTFVQAGVHVGMGFQPYYTHERSKLEAQPVIDRRGNMLAFDGRLDNHEELRTLLGLSPQIVADSSIVLAAFERWGERCFTRLAGDWALALWWNADRSLYLARDHAGTRTLYFEMLKGSLLWSTCLETFFVEVSKRDLDEAYVARYLARQPIHDLTPYKGIQAVTPAHYLCIQGDRIKRKAHWRWLPTNQLRYRTDLDYEEHFFSLFKQAVARRTGPGAPILAELSGGLDSSSIVCMSDYVRKQDGTESAGDQLLNTISYYDDSELSWNERPFFTAVERARGKQGIHIRCSIKEQLLEWRISNRPAGFWPGGPNSSIEFQSSFESALEDSGARVILSGHGGDELLGGVPTPLPELADYLVRGRVVSLIEHTAKWCIHQRRPFVDQLWDVASFSGRLLLSLRPRLPASPSWLQARLTTDASSIYLGRLPSSMVRLPSALSNGRTWWAILETLPIRDRTWQTRPEYRFPYLDRDLVDFLLRVPRRVLAVPGYRRSLMRRALKSIVPQTVLERKRKANITAGPLQAIRDNRAHIEQLFARSLANDFGFIRSASLLAAAGLIADGQQPTLWPFLLRAIDLEMWLISSADRLRKPTGDHTGRAYDPIPGKEIRRALREVQ